MAKQGEARQPSIGAASQRSSQLKVPIGTALCLILPWIAGCEPPQGDAEAAPIPAAPLTDVAALGRIEPRHGLIRLAGPPRMAVVIGELLVEEGDPVKEGQEVALLEGIEVQRAEVARLQAELAIAERELRRKQELAASKVISAAEIETLELQRDAAQASLQRGEADLELSVVRSPLDGRVLDIHARAGERVGPEGIAEIGEVAAMYAVAEVYENDIERIQVGQRARVSSPALPRVLHGTVERIGLKVGKKDVLDTDPVADADARVVEVEIRLDEPEPAARLSNLRVDVVIDCDSDTPESAGTGQ